MPRLAVFDDTVVFEIDVSLLTSECKGKGYNYERVIGRSPTAILCLQVMMMAACPCLKPELAYLIYCVIMLAYLIYCVIMGLPP